MNIEINPQFVSFTEVENVNMNQNSKSGEHFHPPTMCFDSLRKGSCTRQDCKFRHIKGTKRLPD